MEEIAARAIYARDRDFLRTTTPVIHVAIDTTLQGYARASSIQIGSALGSSLSVGFGLEALSLSDAWLARLLQTAKHLSPAMYQFAEATSEVEESHRALREIWPPSKRRPLLFHVRSICLAARKPLDLHEIVKGVLANGYQPRSKRPHVYLLRKLRSDKQFIEIEDGWVICGTDA